MRTTVFCAVSAAVLTALAITGLGHQKEAWAQRNSDVGGTELITVSAMIGDKGQQQLTVIDPLARDERLSSRAGNRRDHAQERP